MPYQPGWATERWKIHQSLRWSVLANRPTPTLPTPPVKVTATDMNFQRVIVDILDTYNINTGKPD